MTRSARRLHNTAFGPCWEHLQSRASSLSSVIFLRINCFVTEPPVNGFAFNGLADALADVLADALAFNEVFAVLKETEDERGFAGPAISFIGGLVGGDAALERVPMKPV